MINQPTGLKPLEDDARDFSHEQVFGSAVALPLTLNRVPKKIKDQGTTQFCFPAKTEVLMEDLTYKNIEKIDVGDNVISHKGNVCRVEKTFKKVWQGKMTKIKIKGDFRPISSTPDHPYFVYRGNKVIEEQAKNVKKGDYLLIPKLKTNKNQFLQSFEEDPNFLWVLGLYLAEGNINEYDVQFTLHIKEKEKENRIREVSKKYGGNVFVSEKPEVNTRVVSLSGKKWTTIFEELGGSYCHKKRINRRLLHAEPKLLFNIIDGYFSGDGYSSKNGKRRTVIGTSFELLKQIRLVLFRCGIKNSFMKRKLRQGRLPSWTIEYYPVAKRTTYREDEDFFYVLVFSVETNPREYFLGGNVYNIEIENDHSYIVNNVAVHNCTAFTVSSASEYQEGVELSPEWQAAKEGQIQGSPIINGTDARTAMKSAVIFGSLEQWQSGYSWQKDGQNVVADYKTWNPALDDYAKKHQKSAFLKVDGGHDSFDNIRSALYQGQKDNAVVMAFGQWFSEWNNPQLGVVSTIYTNFITWHAYLFIDWKQINGKDYLVAQLSQGKNWGDNGLLYFPREVVNKEFAKSGTGLFIFRDLDANSINSLKQQNRSLWQIIIDLLLRVRGVK